MEELIQSGIITPDGEIVVLQGWIGAAIAGAVALASAIIGSSSSKKQTERTNKANLEMAKYQQEANQASIDKQNAFNAPSAQMLRYQQAGLNKNLIYGQGTPGNQQEIAKYQAPTQDWHSQPLVLPDLLGIYQDFSLKQAQVENVEANTRNVDERTTNESLRRMLMELAGRKGEFDLEFKKTLAPYQRDITESAMQSARTKVNYGFEELKQKRLSEPAINLKNENLRMQNVFQKYEEQFRKMGITNADNIFVRILVRMMEKSGFNLLDYVKP